MMGPLSRNGLILGIWVAYFLVVLVIALVAVVSGCNAPTGETVKTLDQALAVLNERGAIYEVTLSGQTSGEIWAKQSLGAGTPGWLFVTCKSPLVNPLAGDGGDDMPVVEDKELIRNVERLENGQHIGEYTRE